MTMLNWSAVATPTGGVKVSTVGLNGPAEMIFPNANLQQMAQGMDRYNLGALIGAAFGFLSAGEREFLMTGLTPEAWDDLFTEDKDEDEGPVLCVQCGAEDKAEDSAYCIYCLAEEKAAHECPLCGRESCSGYCQEFPR